MPWDSPTSRWSRNCGFLVGSEIPVFFDFLLGDNVRLLPPASDSPIILFTLVLFVSPLGDWPMCGLCHTNGLVNLTACGISLEGDA